MEINKGISKLRLLLDDPRSENVCLSDIAKKLSDMARMAASLEIQNNKTHVANHKREIKELEKIVRAYKSRIADEVYPDVELALANKKKGKPRGRPENIIEHNKKAKSTNI